MKESFINRLNQVLPKLLSTELKNNAGPGNEIGFYVFDYAPKYELEVRKHVRLLHAQIAKQKPDLKVSEVNLFELLINYLERRKILASALKMQREKGDAELKRALKGSLHEEKIAQEFTAKAQPEKNDLIFMTGVGSAWPLLRTHTLLNNLHPVMQEKPLIVFYPGDYDGQTLRLLGMTIDKPFYRTPTALKVAGLNYYHQPRSKI